MPEILKTFKPEKGVTFLDNVLSQETFNTLDQHSGTLDRVTTLMDKANKLLSNPLLSKVTDILENTALSKGNIQAEIDPWSQPTLSELAGGAPAQAQQVQQIRQPTVTAPMPQGAAQEPSNTTPKSLIHGEVHKAIDGLDEGQLMELMMKLNDDPDVKKEVEKVIGDDIDETSESKHTE